MKTHKKISSIKSCSATTSTHKISVPLHIKSHYACAAVCNNKSWCVNICKKADFENINRMLYTPFQMAGITTKLVTSKCKLHTANSSEFAYYLLEFSIKKWFGGPVHIRGILQESSKADRKGFEILASSSNSRRRILVKFFNQCVQSHGEMK